MSKRILIVVCFVVLIIGCKKEYPDDRWRHTRTPFKRLINHTWNYVDHDNLTPYVFTFGSQVRDSRINFNNDGTCTGILSSGGGPSSYSYNFQGSWELIENDDKIKITHNSSYSSIWMIHQLERTGLTISNDSIKYYLK